MLARVNRLVRGDEYRRVVRRGRQISTRHLVVYSVARGGGAPRCGFIVSKAVGNAVVRNRVRRRLKAAVYECLRQIPPGVDVVVRALPASASATWATLRKEVFDAIIRVEVSI